MEAVVAGARFTQVLGAAVLFGTPLFLVYGLPASGRSSGAALHWPRPLLAVVAGVVFLASLVSLCGQTAMMAGDPAAALDMAMVGGVVTDSAFGLAVAVRLAVAVLAIAAGVILRPGRALWLALSGLGAIALGSLAWGGHGAADEGLHGLIHLPADILHLLAAGVWLGALAALALLLIAPSREDPDATRTLHAALAGFSGIGAAVVAVILATGLVNSWFLVGPNRIPAMLTTAYGQLLLIKIGLFWGMIALAGLNRFIHTPALARDLETHDASAALKALQLSVLIELAAGVLVLVLASILGMLAPISAQ